MSGAAEPVTVPAAAARAQQLAEDAEARVQPAASEGEREHWLRVADYWWREVVRLEDGAA